MTDTMRAAIAIENLIFQYREGDFHLRIPRLDVDAGTKSALIGPSGSGKTTLIHLLAGIVPADSGHLMVHGAPLNQLGDAERRRFRIANIGFVFQDFALLDYLTILDNMLYPYRINRALNLTPQVRDHAIHLAALMGIEDKLKRHPHHLSQGEKQRAAICRALVTRPPLLLADEPTGNLDPANKSHILQLLFQYIDDHGATLVAVTHDHGLLSGFDRVIDFQSFHYQQ
jgi:putative ABC transport system ATP-binding protein